MREPERGVRRGRRCPRLREGRLRRVRQRADAQRPRDRGRRRPHRQGGRDAGRFRPVLVRRHGCRAVTLRRPVRGPLGENRVIPGDTPGMQAEFATIPRHT
ncbi:hypothetical protein PLANTIT3_30051 [Plantibacter sp. T3]|nr:hypothetical protein PLANTIT3_30051 [Plantibacter sp. T3]